MHLHGISTLFSSRAFALGLAYGGVGLMISIIVGMLGRRAMDLAGIAIVAAAWLGVRAAWGPELANLRVAFALALLVVCGGLGFVARDIRKASDHPLLVSAVAMAPGAVVLAVSTPLAGTTLSRGILALAVIAVGVGMRDFDSHHGPRGGAWLLFAITAAGVYLSVPDTELARVFIGVAIPFALLSVPSPVARLGPAGAAGMAGVFSWVVFVGGRGRPGSVVAGLATIGILCAEPIGRRAIGSIVQRRRRTSAQPWLIMIGVVAISQGVIALYASRIVGRQDTAPQAFFVLLPVIALSVVFAPMLYPQDQPRGLRRRRRTHLEHSARHERSHTLRNV
jgi:hypothetical protein